MKINLRNYVLTISITLDKSYRADVIKELKEGRRLAACKIYKDATGKSLRECIEYIDNLSY